jgi:uncharacterized membrane protein YdjX (TVP38/TMEM64 family)
MHNFVRCHYTMSVISFMAIYLLLIIMSLPIATFMTIAGGMLFGTFYGILYSLIGGVLGSLIAFFGIRYFVGDWLQHRYHDQLRVMNEQMHRYGSVYLLVLHFIIVIPFTFINLLAGLTDVSWWTFTWTTVVGMLPISIVYALAGQKLAVIESFTDLFSLKFMLIMMCMTILLLLPLGMNINGTLKKGKY